MQNALGARERIQQHADKRGTPAGLAQDERHRKEYLTVPCKIANGGQSGGRERRIGKQGSGVLSEQQHRAQQQECE